MATTTVPNPAALEVLARAEKRLTGHIATHGIDYQALAICATYERMYDLALNPPVTSSVDNDIDAAIRAVA